MISAFFKGLRFGNLQGIEQALALQSGGDFEPLTSAVQPPARLTVAPLPTAQLRQYWNWHYRPNALR